MLSTLLKLFFSELLVLVKAFFGKEERVYHNEPKFNVFTISRFFITILLLGLIYLNEVSMQNLITHNIYLQEMCLKYGCPKEKISYPYLMENKPNKF